MDLRLFCFGEFPEEFAEYRMLAPRHSKDGVALTALAIPEPLDRNRNALDRLVDYFQSSDSGYWSADLIIDATVYYELAEGFPMVDCLGYELVCLSATLTNSIEEYEKPQLPKICSRLKPERMPNFESVHSSPFSLHKERLFAQEWFSEWLQKLGDNWRQGESVCVKSKPRSDYFEIYGVETVDLVEPNSIEQSRCLQCGQVMAVSKLNGTHLLRAMVPRFAINTSDFPHNSSSIFLSIEETTFIESIPRADLFAVRPLFDWQGEIGHQVQNIEALIESARGPHPDWASVPNSE